MSNGSLLTIGVKLSQIAAAPAPPDAAASFVGVSGSQVDFRYSLPQLIISGNLATLDDVDQVVTGGCVVTSAILPPGNITIDPGLCPLQSIANNGPFTITAPTQDGSCLVLVTNGSAAGLITFVDFAVGGNTGDPLDNVIAHRFTLSIWRIAAVSGYRVAAHQ